jgi:cob(I)alamin adenosyltransferase
VVAHVAGRRTHDTAVAAAFVWSGVDPLPGVAASRILPRDRPRKDMGHRLSKIVTRTGDAGTTGLGDGSRVAKDSLRITAIGEIDELNSTLGLLLAEPLPEAVAVCLTSVQHDLFDLGGELSIPGHTAVTEAQVARLEQAVEEFNADLGALKEFILPGGTRAAAVSHVARTVCRRAERALVRMTATEPVGDAARRYLNRLSDLLFVLARTLNRAAGRPDVLWQRRRPG